MLKKVKTKKNNELKWNRFSKFKSKLFLTPSVIGVFVFFVIPFFVVIYYSFIDNIFNKEFVFLENFKIVFNNEAFKMAALNTLKFTMTAVPLAVILSLLMANLMMSQMPGKSKFRTIFLSPLMVPIASIILIFQVLFHYNGVVNDFISIFGVENIDWFKSEYAPIIIVILYLWKNLGYNMVLFMAGLANIPKSIIEVAKLDCSSSLKIFFKVKLRYLSPTILFVTVLSIINSFKVFREIYLLTGDYPYESLYMLQHFMNNTFASLDYQKMSAAAVIMFDVMAVIIGILFVIENRYGKDVEH
ncbi:MAG: sugar ABC transporter permease [Lachnospiraceae bacterium]|nr:sugar ABC transporter permease [Lachnospiraceae bacterium]